MEQRRLRLGDILDDYCPRERRVTNHAVVAMIGDAVKQTRCATCDADHPYKGGKAPAPRRKKDVGALGGDVVEHTRPRVATPAVDTETDLPPATVAEPVEPTPLAAASDADQSSAHVEEHETNEDTPSEDTPTEERQGDDEWPMHRRLIRAQLPRVEGQTPERKEVDFTVRRPTTGRGPDANRGGAIRPHHPAF